MPNTPKKSKIRNDIILISAILSIALIGLGAYFLFANEGSKAVVTVDGEIYGTYDLNQDIQVEIRSGADNSSTNVLVICDGKASISQASCKDLICVKHFQISKEGEVIVCLPNKVVVTIE